MKNEEIAVLAEKVLQDKSAYFEELYQETWKTVYYYCYKNLGNEQDAKDAMQTVFVQLYQKLDTLYHPNAFNKFLYTIMRYTCSDFRKAKFRNETEELEDYETLQDDDSDFLPSEAFEKYEIRQEIAKLVESLPQKQREAIFLFYFEGMSIKEIAEITDSKFDAVNNRLVTARKSLREYAEALIGKGALSRVMSIMPTPILTRILTEEAELVATSEICALAWTSISGSLFYMQAAGTGAVVAAEAAAVTATAATSTTASLAVNIAIYTTAAAVVTTGGVLAYQVSENLLSPPAIVWEYEAEDEAGEETYGVSDTFDETFADTADLELRLSAITSRTELMEFTETHGFRFLGGSWASGRGSQMLFYLEQQDNIIYLGYTEDLQHNFHLTYEIADSSIPRITADGVGDWFLR